MFCHIRSAAHRNNSGWKNCGQKSQGTEWKFLSQRTLVTYAWGPLCQWFYNVTCTYVHHFWPSSPQFMNLWRAFQYGYSTSTLSVHWIRFMSWMLIISCVHFWMVVIDIWESEDIQCANAFTYNQALMVAMGSSTSSFLLSSSDAIPFCIFRFLVNSSNWAAALLGKTLARTAKQQRQQQHTQRPKSKAKHIMMIWIVMTMKEKR